jgi:CRP/FNR family cyclic AMP-dependent transcriptional regulator
MKTLSAQDQTRSRLLSIPLFSELSSEGIETMLGIVELHRYHAGSLIVGRSGAGTCMYLLASGRVKVSLGGPDGKEFVLNYLEAPAEFGEMELVEQRARASDIIAVTEVELFTLDGRDLASAIQRRPRIALSLIATLARRLRQTSGRLEDIAFHDAAHRVMRVLLNAATAGMETRGAPVIQGMTHYDIATLASTSRETASRVISQLQREHVVATKGRTIVVKLSSLCERLVQNP